MFCLIKKTIPLKNIVCLLLWASGILSSLLIGVATIEAFEKMPVERTDLQAKLLKAVLKFSTRQLDHLTVGIIYVPEAKKIAQRFADELKKLRYNKQSIEAVLIHSEQLDSFDEAVNILYVTPGNAAFLDMIFSIAAERKIFSCSGIPEYVRNEKVALGFGEYKGKPQIVLNLAVAQNTDHDFKNPKFLNLQATHKLILIKDQ